MKSLLIGINSQFVHLNLAIRSIKASCDNENLEIQEYNINGDKIAVFGDILRRKADIVMFSCYIWNITYVLDIAEDLKKANKDIKIVLGGPEVSFNAFDVLEKNAFVDYIICGECEEIMPKFLDLIEKNISPDGLNGVAIQGGFGNDNYNLVQDINTLKPASEIYKNIEQHKIYYYETTRGCPYSCSYCLSGSIKDTTRYLDLDRVFDDFKYFSDNNIPLVKLVDRTFNANKKRAKEIIRFASEHTGNTSFHFEVGADILDDEIIELLNNSKPGKFQLEAGVQSCNEKTLEAVVRTTNFEKLSANVKKIIDADNVHLHLDLIAGLPFEDFKTFGNSINQLYVLNAHHLQLGFLKMLLGSIILNDAEKYGIVYRKYAPYEVISTNDITAEEIIKLKDIEEIIERYYNENLGRKAMEILLKNFETPFDMLCDLASDFRKKGHLSAPMSIQNRLEVLCIYLKEKLTEKDYKKALFTILIDLLTVTSKGSIPESLYDIVSKIDNKPYKNKLFELKVIDGEQYKKSKFIIVDTKVIIAYNSEIKIVDMEDLC